MAWFFDLSIRDLHLLFVQLLIFKDMIDSEKINILQNPDLTNDVKKSLETPLVDGSGQMKAIKRKKTKGM